MNEIQDTIKTVNGMGGKETKTLFSKLARNKIFACYLARLLITRAQIPKCNLF